MTKKTKILIIGLSLLLVVIAIVATVLLVVLNKKTSKLKLETPTVTLQIDGNEKLLVARYNPNATQYIFYIYADGDNPDQLYNYAPFQADENQLDKNYLDVTNVFVDAKDYYYCCQLIGDEKKFNNSNVSSPEKFTNKKSIFTPKLSLTDKILSWTTIPNSNGYKLKINGVEQRDVVTSQSIDISSILARTSDKILSFSVKALGKEYYYDSEYSNSVSFTKKYILSQVNNLLFNNQNNTLVWDKVDNATKYEILLNNQITLFSFTNSFDFSDYLSDVGVYEFKVRAIGNEDFAGGQFSEAYIYTKKHKLDSVNQSSINWTIEKEWIRISWDKPAGAENYTVLINGEIFQDALEVETIYFRKPTTNNILIEIYVNGYGYYEKSNTTIKQIDL